MTGPEHYLAAERLADQANHFTYGDGADPVVGAALAAEAQARATLALAAAIAMQAPVDGSEPGMSSEEWRAWYAVAGVRPVRDQDEPTNEDMFTGDDLREMDEVDEYGQDAQTHAESIAAAQAELRGDYS